jgi:hypothetical protein
VDFRRNGGIVVALPSPKDNLTLDTETVVLPLKTLDRQNWKSEALASIPTGGDFLVTVLEDGTLRAHGVDSVMGSEGPALFASGDHSVLLGTEMNWQAVAGNGTIVVALKTDGSLWKWSFQENPLIKSDAASASRLGTQSDWIAITAAGSSVFALAGDGSLWLFQFDLPHPASDLPFPPLLSVSRRPQKVGNIFGEIR